MDVGHCADLDLSEVLLIVFGKIRGVETSSIDELYFTLFVLQTSPNAVSGRMRYLRNYDSLLAYKLVDHGRFSDVGSTNQTDLDYSSQSQIFGLGASAAGEDLLGPQESRFEVLAI